MNNEEEQTRLNIGNEKAITSATIPIKLKVMCQDNRIGMSESLTFGARFLLAEKGLLEHPLTSLDTKLKKIMEKFQELNEENIRLKEQLEGNKEEDVEEEVDKVFGSKSEDEFVEPFEPVID